MKIVTMKQVPTDSYSMHLRRQDTGNIYSRNQVPDPLKMDIPENTIRFKITRRKIYHTLEFLTFDIQLPFKSELKVIRKQDSQNMYFSTRIISLYFFNIFIIQRKIILKFFFRTNVVESTSELEDEIFKEYLQFSYEQENLKVYQITNIFFQINQYSLIQLFKKEPPLFGKENSLIFLI